MVLLCCTSSLSYSDTTGDILDPSTISGSYEACSGSDCWGGTSGGSNPSWSGDTARWGYGGGILAWNYALEQALAYAGINIDGYNYSWRIKNRDANATQGCTTIFGVGLFCSGDGDDYMRVSVRFYDADNNELWGKQYNLDGTYDWSTFSGQELFTDSLSGADVETIIIRAEGDDPGNWAGHYGPEFDVSNSSVTLIYSNNPCWPDPLYSPTCDGYAEAYAEKQLQELMEELNAPVEETNVIETTPTQTSSQSTGGQSVGSSGTDSETTQTLAVQETANTEGAKRDSRDAANLARSLDAANNFDVSSVSGAPTADAGLDVAAAAEQQVIGGSLDASMDQTISGLGGLPSSNTTSEQNQQASQTREERQERREKLKELTESRANEIAEENAEAESMDEQAQQQMEQLALMNFVPGFDTYGISLNGGVYPDVAFYKPTTVPESKRGLRNGLAQQLLHEQMIDMQYRREQ